LRAGQLRRLLHRERPMRRRRRREKLRSIRQRVRHLQRPGANLHERRVLDEAGYVSGGLCWLQSVAVDGTAEGIHVVCGGRFEGRSQGVRGNRRERDL
jgi:hypothetical protein